MLNEVVANAASYLLGGVGLLLMLLGCRAHVMQIALISQFVKREGVVCLTGNGCGSEAGAE